MGKRECVYPDTSKPPDLASSAEAVQTTRERAEKPVKQQKKTVDRVVGRRVEKPKPKVGQKGGDKKNDKKKSALLHKRVEELIGDEVGLRGVALKSNGAEAVSEFEMTKYLSKVPEVVNGEVDADKVLAYMREHSGTGARQLETEIRNMSSIEEQLLEAAGVQIPTPSPELTPAQPERTRMTGEVEGSPTPSTNTIGANGTHEHHRMTPPVSSPAPEGPHPLPNDSPLPQFHSITITDVGVTHHGPEIITEWATISQNVLKAISFHREGIEIDETGVRRAQLHQLIEELRELQHKRRDIFEYVEALDKLVQALRQCHQFYELLGACMGTLGGMERMLEGLNLG